VPPLVVEPDVTAIWNGVTDETLLTISELPGRNLGPFAVADVHELFTEAGIVVSGLTIEGDNDESLGVIQYMPVPLIVANLNFGTVASG
jgi:hypothetical protein